MITVRNLSLSYGEQTVFERASLQVNEGDRLALVGPNGAGKSTLFRILLGEAEPDEGTVQIKKGIAIGHLAQEHAALTEDTVLAQVLSAVAEPDGRAEAGAKAILAGLGFRQRDFTRPVRELSGGWRMRVAMAALLLREPDVLLLDEPTNHLDLVSLLWFRDHLVGYPGTLVLISHDRAFINAVCGAIVNLDRGALKVYPGDYERFVAQRDAEQRQLEAAHKVQRKKIAQMQEFIDRNRARLSTARLAQSMIKRLEKVERIELPPEPDEISIRLPQPVRSGKVALELKAVDKAYGDLEVFRGLDFMMQRGQRMAFIGANGAGKSTLLKILAGVLEFDGGERRLGHNVTVGYHSQHHGEVLHPDLTVLEEAMAGDQRNGERIVRTVLGSFLFSGDDVFKKVGVLSGGEKSRLSLVKILLNPPNVLLLDEPTTHLDMTSVEALIEALKQYEGTLAFISHDVYFINEIARQVVSFENGRVSVYPGNFELFRWRENRLERAG